LAAVSVELHFEMYWREMSAYNVLVGKSERKIPLGRPRRRWEDNIRMGLREM
jgi:hypothetical protein